MLPPWVNINLSSCTARRDCSASSAASWLRFKRQAHTAHTSQHGILPERDEQRLLNPRPKVAILSLGHRNHTV